MYCPEHFAEHAPEALHDLIRRHPLGMLVTQQGGLPDADHLPFELDADAGVLRAHVARSNPLWQRCDGQAVLVVFRGAEAYVSPNWYPSKQAHHRQVPTWNYQVVHARGRLVVRDDPRFVTALVGRLTREHEAGTGEAPWKMSDAPRDYLAQMLANIVGIEIPIESLTGKFKLSQNKDTADIEAAAGALDCRGAAELAAAMRP